MYKTISMIQSDAPVLVEDWTAAEAAAAIGKSRRTVLRMIQNGELDAYKVNTLKGPSWRITPASVLKAIELETLLEEQLKKASIKAPEDALIEMLYDKIDKLEKQIDCKGSCSCSEKQLDSNATAITSIKEESVHEQPIAIERKYPHLNWWNTVCNAFRSSLHLARLPVQSETVA